MQNLSQNELKEMKRVKDYIKIKKQGIKKSRDNSLKLSKAVRLAQRSKLRISKRETRKTSQEEKKTKRNANSLDLNCARSLANKLKLPIDFQDRGKDGSPDAYLYKPKKQPHLDFTDRVSKNRMLRLKKNVSKRKVITLERSSIRSNSKHHLSTNLASKEDLTVDKAEIFIKDNKLQESTPMLEKLSKILQKIEEEEGETSDVKEVKEMIADSIKKNSSEIATSLRYYKIIKLLGKGSFGKVYLASQVLTNRVVAIKCLEKKLVKYGDRKEKILQELLMFKTLTGGPSITKIYEVFENQKYYFFVMEYANGGDLLQKMKSEGKLDENEARDIFAQLVRGIYFIHSKKILHRDIKLDNILLTKKDNKLLAQICDFGVSRFLGPGEVINEQCGTPAYIAPEIIRKKGYKGYKADIWSLGVLLYAMVIGSMPFRAEEIEALHQKILNRDCEMKSNSASPQVLNLIEKMLCVDPENRFSIEEVAKHPWIKDHPEIQAISKNHEDIFEELDGFLIHKLCRFGYPEKYIRKSLKCFKLNHVFACYLTLIKDLE